MKKLRIGTRPSKLAITQTETVGRAIHSLMPEIEIETIVIRTSGDLKQGISSPISRDKRDWIEELESAILEDKIDLAIHSGKDVPYDISPGTRINSVLVRADPRDIFIGKQFEKKRLRFCDLPRGATIGTASLRRRAQLLLLRPDLNIVELRGNVTTRVARLDNESEFSGIVLAAAGLERLGIPLDSMEILTTDRMLPASAQGILTAQYKAGQTEISELLEKLCSGDTEAALFAERAVIRCLGANCSSAVAAYSYINGENIELCGRVFSKNGSEFIEAKATNLKINSELVGLEVGNSLIQLGALKLIAEV